MTDAPALSPFSCLSCRLSHRKCDRILPSCEQCSSKRKICQYEEPTKRGRKPKSSLYMPYTIPKPQASKTMNNSSIMKMQNQIIANNPQMKQIMILPAYILSQDQYQNVYNYIWRDSAASNLMKPSDEHISIVCSVQAVQLRAAHELDLANKFYTKARQAICSCFDRVQSNFTIAVAFAYLGLYCVGENDLDLASFYVENAERYLIKSDTSNTVVSAPIQFLRWLINATNNTATGDDNMENFVSLLISHEQITRPDSDLSNDEVKRMTNLNQLYKIFQPSHTVKSLMLSILLLGLGLQRAIRANYNPNNIYSFTQSLAMYCNCDVFRYLPPFVAGPLSLAANVVIDCASLLPQEKIHEVINTMQSLKTGLEDLSAKYTIVKARYEVTIARLMKAISMYLRNDINRAAGVNEFNSNELEQILRELLESDQGSSTAYEMNWLNDINDDSFI